MGLDCVCPWDSTGDVSVSPLPTGVSPTWETCVTAEAINRTATVPLDWVFPAASSHLHFMVSGRQKGAVMWLFSYPCCSCLSWRRDWAWAVEISILSESGDCLLDQLDFAYLTGTRRQIISWSFPSPCKPGGVCFASVHFRDHMAVQIYLPLPGYVLS